MPLDWTAYDAFGWADSRQQPLAVAERDALADVVADVLALPPEVRSTVWGAASPPGRYAATVVRVGVGELPSPWRDRAVGLAAVGVKVFKTTPDARREADRLLRFHEEQLPRLPGLPHPRVQRSLAPGRTSGRAWLVLEWMPGLDLEQWRGGFSKASPTPLADALDLVRQLVGEIVLPLWSGGLVWWDFRDANCCVEPATNRLSLLDVDSLAAYADEILTTPADWTQRDRGRATAEGRLRNMSWRLLQSAGRSSKKAESAFRAAWDAHVAPALATVGRSTTLEAARAGVAAFLAVAGVG